MGTTMLVCVLLYAHVSHVLSLSLSTHGRYGDQTDVPDSTAMCITLNRADYPVIQTPGLCNLSEMGLTKILPNIPTTTLILDLSYNNLDEIPNNTLPSQLVDLDLSHNSISWLDVLAFGGLTHLRVLDLSYNLLIGSHGFADGVFHGLTSMGTLYLHGNIISGNTQLNYGASMFPDKALSNLHSLNTLVLDGPATLFIGAGFRGLTSLRNLSFGHDGKACITHALFNDTFHYISRELKYLNMSYCALTSISNSTLSGFYNLRTLDLSHNKDLTLPKAVKVLDPLNHSFDFIGLGSVNPYVNSSGVAPTYTRLSADNAGHFLQLYVKHIDLSDNSIVSINVTLMKNMLNYLHHLELPHNVLNGSKETLALLKGISSSHDLESLDLSMQRQSLAHNWHPSFSIGRVNAILMKPFQQNIHKKSIEYMSVFNKTVSIKVPPKLIFANLSGFVALSESLTGSDGKFSFTTANNLTNVDLSNNDLQCKITITGVESIQSLRISGNDCSELNINIFKSMSKLEHIWIDDAQLGSGRIFQKLGQHLLKPLPNLKLVSVAGNGIHQLPVDFFEKNINLTTIILSRNNFKTLQKEWLFHQELESIDLRNNSIQIVDVNTTVMMDNITKHRPFTLFLGNNILSCSCEHLAFIRWIYTTNVQLDKHNGYTCIQEDGSQANTDYMYDIIDQLEIQCISRDIWVIVMCLSIVIILILVSVSLLYRHRWTLQYMWWKMKMKWGVSSSLNETSDGITEDLFVMYSHEDTEWVVQTLVNKLEKELGFKLSFYGRNFLPGSEIYTQILSYMFSSRGSLFVVTKCYLNSEYSNFEIRMAALKCLDDLNHKIYVILKDDVPYEKLPRFLQQLWNRVVCLPWTFDEAGQRDLWRKLEEALRKNRPASLQTVSGAIQPSDDTGAFGQSTNRDHGSPVVPDSNRGQPVIVEGTTNGALTSSDSALGIEITDGATATVGQSQGVSKLSKKSVSPVQTPDCVNDASYDPIMNHIDMSNPRWFEDFIVRREKNKNPTNLTPAPTAAAADEDDGDVDSDRSMLL